MGLVGRVGLAGRVGLVDRTAMDSRTAESPDAFTLCSHRPPTYPTYPTYPAHATYPTYFSSAGVDVAGPMPTISSTHSSSFAPS
jgi:hypothetical protein